ncbi:MAG: radical SAM protein [Clostridiales bacterium]|nr:radical SAM protein [Clostridiales bacterium]
MQVNNRREKIPPFPHHKNFLYRIDKFFNPNSFFTQLSHGNFITVKEVIRGYKHKCAIPRVLLIDPTSSCNLRCKGCWAADYAKGDSLSFEKLDDIINQSEKLGIMDIQLSGGEPLLRKDDILRLCRKHRKTTFGVFTNATLIDEEFADGIAEVGNLNMYVSIEGTREETDFRRGEGVHEKVLKAMSLLKERNIGFAFSTCYHSKNYKTIASDEFLDEMRDRGAWFGWLFNYVPVGKDADLSLVCTPEQRAWVREKIIDYCKRKNCLIIDFWNSGHTAYGCVAAGSGYLHINAKGDVEPCAFCHYSDCNIHELSLVEALRSPFLTSFRASQPFSDNPLRACPMIDVPEAITDVINKGGAHSTHYSEPEPIEVFVDKVNENAKKWEPVANELKESLGEDKAKIYNTFVEFLNMRKRITDGRRKVSFDAEKD